MLYVSFTKHSCALDMLNGVGWLAQSFSPLSTRTHAALGRPMHDPVLPVVRIGELERPCTLEVPSKLKE